MKKRFLKMSAVFMSLFVLAACGEDEAPATAVSGDANGDATEEVVAPEPAPAPTGDVETINLWSFTDEIPNAAKLFMHLHPEYAERFEFNFVIVSDDDNMYSIALDPALEAGGSGMPHIFTAESAFVLRYTQGIMSDFVMPYADLGIDLGLIDSAQIAPYTVEIGTRGNDVVGLAFQSTGGAMIYRRDIARDVFGTDDPDEIAEITGANGWDSFLDAARVLNDAGVAAVVGAGDIWQAVRTGGDQPWVVDGELVIDPFRADFMEIHRALYQEGLMLDGGAWTPDWFAGMDGAGEREVFAFFGPAWLINHVMVNHVDETYGEWGVAVPPVGFFWGGTWLMANNQAPESLHGVMASSIEWVTLDASSNGFQYKFANGTFERALYDAGIIASYGTTKDVVSSAVVNANADSSVSLLGGQEMAEIFIPAAAYATGAALTPYDININDWFLDQSELYATGEKTREEALRDFKQSVQDNTPIIVNFD